MSTILEKIAAIESEVCSRGYDLNWRISDFIVNKTSHNSFKMYVGQCKTVLVSVVLLKNEDILRLARCISDGSHAKKQSYSAPFGFAQSPTSKIET